MNSHDDADHIRELRERIDILEKEVKTLREQISSKDETIDSLNETILQLQTTIKELTGRLNMNSSNSSKPPSTDVYVKPSPRSLREKTGKKPGAQKGHKGSNIKLPHKPDEVVNHYPKRCTTCTKFKDCESKGIFSCSEKRYVIDAVMLTKVTEHKTMAASCPFADKGSERCAASFPDEIKAYIQYGPSFSTVATLLDTYGAVSDSRISELMRNMFDVTISPGTIVSMTKKFANELNVPLGHIRQKILDSNVCHFDETGARVNGKLEWIHNASTDKYTLLTIDGKRGTEGIENNGILPEFSGTMIHDCFAPYWKYEKNQHGICGAHILRELRGISENEPEHKWVEKMAKLLIGMKTEKEKTLSEHKKTPSEDCISNFKKRFDEILELADRECPPPPTQAVRKRGRKKKGKERSLIERLRQKKDSFFIFIEDANVPFDNNQAERDLRNTKSKLKISGCFRSEYGAQNYLDIMSFISTCMKNNINIYDATIGILDGTLSPEDPGF